MPEQCLIVLKLLLGCVMFVLLGCQSSEPHVDCKRFLPDKALEKFYLAIGDKEKAQIEKRVEEVYEIELSKRPALMASLTGAEAAYEACVALKSEYLCARKKGELLELKAETYSRFCGLSLSHFKKL